jgi:hypothetical protein
MSAEIYEHWDFLWKIVERDLVAYLKGGPDMETANVGRMLILRDREEVAEVKRCWAEARKLREESLQQREGA